MAPSGARLTLQADHGAAGPAIAACRPDARRSWSRIPFHVLHVLGHGAAGHGQAIAVHVAVIEQGIHQQRHAAGFEHVLGDIHGRPVSDRRCRASFLKISATSNRSNLMPHSCAIAGRCQRGVGRAARWRQPPAAAFSSALRVTMSRGRNVLVYEIHDHLAGEHAEPVADLVGRRRAGRVRQREPDCFRHGRHGVGGELRAAGAGRGTGILLQRVEVLVAELADACVCRPPRRPSLDGDFLAL